ncbi:hypothetical protein DPMN_112417 [Dreissena polymorpha]|uniref:Uncharacterized protein n=1 Tax=Dreissena polymorpha TaxID=45954 RepID=A0A9D4KGB5_DREPO|nr:hypothetical protein DPMN_112417 [Dreissena polymorpha]
MQPPMISARPIIARHKANNSNITQDCFAPASHILKASVRGFNVNADGRQF